MGTRLLAYFDEADRLGGLVAKMLLASMIQITSTEAGTAEDDPERLDRASKALEKLRAKFAKPDKQTDATTGRVETARRDNSDVGVLRKHIATYLDLMAQRSLFLGDVETTMRRITEAASSTLGVRRVSVWFCDEGATKITCKDLFEQGAPRPHTSGVELNASDFEPYFLALRKETTIAAHDANRDPRTSCFSKVYLQPLGINSMLDVPIWADKKMVGVVCHEHVGPARKWNEDEERFAYLMSNFVALALERASRAAAAHR
jgi:transcriptional regulator with GAF, ATPase, and Fis domain